MNTPSVISVPPTTLARLEQLITQRDTIDGQIQAIVATLRDALNVPTEYLITDVRRGFVSPPANPETVDVAAL